MGISLDKRVETALVSLQKAAQKAPVDLGDVCAQVTASIDHSLSMAALYSRGVVQESVERALALSLTGLDDDGVVPIRFYDNKVYETIDATRDNYEGLVDRFVRSHSMGGTAYAPVLQSLLEKPKRGVFRKAEDEKSQPPYLHLFFTDGAPQDKNVIDHILIGARTRPHFFQFIMLGTDRAAINYLDYLNNELSGPGIDNVGVTIYSDPSKLSDADFFDDIVSEFFPVWLPQARQQGLTTT